MLAGDITRPGMSPGFAEAKEFAPGRFEGVDLTMRGDGTVLFHVTLAGEVFERQLQI